MYIYMVLFWLHCILVSWLLFLIFRQYWIHVCQPQLLLLSFCFGPENTLRTDSVRDQRTSSPTVPWRISAALPVTGQYLIVTSVVIWCRPLYSAWWWFFLQWNTYCLICVAADMKVWAYLFSHHSYSDIVWKTWKFVVLSFKPDPLENNDFPVNLLILHMPVLPYFLLSFKHLVDCPYNVEIIFHRERTFTVWAEPGGL